VTFAERLLGDTVLLDGGMGSALIARGLQPGACPELWNAERPDEVRDIHTAYFAAGSEVVQTNTFGGSAPALAVHALADRMAELNRAGARLARRAIEAATAVAGPSPRWVAGCLGPTGLYLSPVGDADPAALEDAFAAQAAALAEGGADYLSIETMSDLREALCALRGARRGAALPVTVCLTFERKKHGFFTLMGDRLEEAPRALADAGATAVGANCSVGSETMLEACPILLEASPVPVIVKPNAGLPEIVDGRAVYRQTPEDFAEDVAAMARMGAAAVGGCCGTDASFVAALRRELAR
jgi:methionine synthase I (cobalamin-dependent)